MSFGEMVRYQIIDVFTKKPFYGNPAGVVLNSSGMEKETMQTIAKELNISNVTFLSKGKLGGDFQVRFFTPEKEIGICGHSTIATFFSWAMENATDSNCEALIVTQETCVGIFPVYIRIVDGNVDSVTIELPKPTFQDSHLSRNEICEALNIQKEITNETPLQVVYDGLRFLEVGIKNKEILLGLHLRESDILELSKKLKVDCIQFFTLDTFHSDADFCSRTFFPILGVFEDPVCGTGNAALASYLIRNRIIPTEHSITEIIGEQGFSVSRPGKVHVLIDHNNDKIARLRIRGKAVKVIEGNISIGE